LGGGGGVALRLLMGLVEGCVDVICGVSMTGSFHCYIHVRLSLQ
jgi:hypothetical protein